MKPVIYLMTGLLITACSGKKNAQHPMPVPEIQVASPIQQDVTYTYEYPAYLEAEQTVNLVARIPGFLEQILYTPGQTVKAGQTLFVIEPKPYADRLNVAEAGVKSAEAQLAYARASYDKMKDAMKSRAVSEIDYIQAESSYNSALAALQNAKAELNSAQINLAYCYIKAPFDGRVSRNLTDRGNYVGNGVSTSLATAYKDKQMYAYFNMPYNEFENLPSLADRKNNSIRLADPVNPARTWSGSLDYTSPAVDLNTGTVNVRAIANNPEHELLSGMYVKIIVPYKSVKDALLISESSIGTNQSGRYIYIVGKDSTVMYREIVPGVLENGMREIVSGLNKGELYVTEALINIRPGMKIKPLSLPAKTGNKTR